MAQILMHPAEGRSPKAYALMYAALRWKVFPIWPITSGQPGQGDELGICACSKGAECDRPGKHPIGELVPNGYKDATSDQAKIEAWWGGRPWASIGIATGRASGITVIDADVSDGKPGLVNLTRLAAEHGGIPATFSVNTGSGGLHLYFKFNEVLPTGSNIIAEAVDVRNDDGYVVAPPSLHRMGLYKWSRERGELLELPEWMRPQAAQRDGQQATRRRRGPGRPRTRAGMPLERVTTMLEHVDPDDRDKWLRMGVILGRLFYGVPEEAEAWQLYERWAARSDKFDEDRAANITRMREMFYTTSQEAPRAGAEPVGAGTLVLWAQEGGWSPWGDREAVRYEAGNESGMTLGLVAALSPSNRFFNIMGEIRDVQRSVIPNVRLLQEAHSSGSTNLPETLHVRRTTIPSIQHALSEVAVLTSIGADGTPNAKPIPESIAAMILKERAGEFPVLTGIAQWPMVGLDGTLLFQRQRGWDHTTGLYFDIDPTVEIDEAISPTAAWDWMKNELLVDFPFATDEGRVGALAMLLCMMQRPLMKTTPGFAVVAPQPGSGKSTLVEVASLAVHGQPIASHAFSSEEEELRKALHSLIVAKIPAVLFDNIGRGKSVSSDHLAKLITSETAADRMLGSSETRKEPNQILMLFTGNNITFVRDMASRVVVLNLNAGIANPLRRSFRHPDIRVYARKQRNKTLSALISVARMADGERPPGGASRFEDYDLLIVQPILRLTGVDIRSLHTENDVDAEEDHAIKDLLGTLFKWQEQWRGEENKKRWRVRDLISAAVAGNAWPDAAKLSLKQFAADQRAWESDPQRLLGYRFRAIKDDHKYQPYVLTSQANSDGVLWLVKCFDGAPFTPLPQGAAQQQEPF